MVARKPERASLVLLLLLSAVAVMPQAARAADEPSWQSSIATETTDPGETAQDRGAGMRTVLTWGTLQLGIQYSVLYFSQPDNWKAYGNSLEPTWTKFSSNFRVAPVWKPVEYGGGGFVGLLQADGDPWVTNVVGHGLQGSEVYLRMRAEGFTVLEAFLMGAAHSTVWEYGVEGWNETPSAWDLAFTPVGGLVIGELRYQAVRFFERRAGDWFSSSMALLIDPVGAIDAALE